MRCSATAGAGVSVVSRTTGLHRVRHAGGLARQPPCSRLARLVLCLSSGACLALERPSRKRPSCWFYRASCWFYRASCWLYRAGDAINGATLRRRRASRVALASRCMKRPRRPYARSSTYLPPRENGRIGGGAHTDRRAQNNTKQYAAVRAAWGWSRRWSAESVRGALTRAWAASAGGVGYCASWLTD